MYRQVGFGDYMQKVKEQVKKMQWHEIYCMHREKHKKKKKKTTDHQEDPGSFPCRSQSRTPNKEIHV